MAENLALAAIATCVAACILNMAKKDGRNFSCGPLMLRLLPLLLLLLLELPLTMAVEQRLRKQTWPLCWANMLNYSIKVILPVTWLYPFFISIF